MERFFSWTPLFFFQVLTRYSWFFLGSLGLFIFWTLSFLPQLEINNSPETYFPKESSTVQRFVNYPCPKAAARAS
jgi:hypothetical protein